MGRVIQLLITGTGVVCAIASPSASAALPAFDHAGDPAYHDGWQSGDNGGHGFAPWMLIDGTFEIRSSTQNNSLPIGMDIDSAGGRAWAVAKNNDPDPLNTRALAMRPLIGALTVGQTVTVDFDSVMGPNQEAGVALATSDGSARLRFYDLGAAFKVDDASGIRHIGPGGLAVHGLHLEITFTGTDTYALSYAPAGESPTLITGTLAGPSGGVIDRIVLDRSIFPGPFAFFNDIAVVPEPGIALLVALFAVCGLRFHQRAGLRATARLLAWTIPALVTFSAAGALTAFDHAAARTYDDGWHSGDNGGFGFQPWVLTNGTFDISSSTGNSGATASGDIDSAGGRAWAIYTEELPGLASASRGLTGALEAGQRITFDFDTSMTPNEFSRVAIEGPAGPRLTIFNPGGDFLIVDAGGARPVGSGRLAERGLHFDFLLTGPDTYLLGYGLPGDPPNNIIGMLAGSAGDSIDRLVIERSGAFLRNNNAYLNNIAVVPEPGAIAMWSCFALAIGLARRITAPPCPSSAARSAAARRARS